MAAVRGAHCCPVALFRQQSQVRAMKNSAGIHHITAIAGNAKRHFAFYTGTLGLKLVKKTVNFDAPDTWHLYYGDETGSPGTTLTFFIWEELPRGHHGAGEAQEIAFSVPEASLDFWRARLRDKGVNYIEPAARFGEKVIAFEDPDGLKLELVGSKAANAIKGWGGGDVPAEHAIRGFHGITLEVRDVAKTAEVLTQVFGFAPAGVEDYRYRFVAKPGPLGTVVDLRHTPGLARANQGTGAVHHVAFRADGDASEVAMREKAVELGLHATEQVPRFYFRSVYFRERNGILFEIATDDPGFATDETKDALGQKLQLPPWHEPLRGRIEAVLPPLE
jgi:glyoxalase family protein